MKDLRKFLEQHLKEDSDVKLEEILDLENAEKGINDEINNVVAKNKPDTSKLKEETTVEILKELGIEGNSIDDLKLYAKKMSGNTDEFKEANIKLESRIKELEEKYNTTQQEKDELQQKYQTKEQMDMIKSMGVKDDMVDYLHYKVKNQVGEDKTFEDALKEYKESEPKYFKDTQTSNFRKVPNMDDGEDGDTSVLEAFKARQNKN